MKEKTQYPPTVIVAGPLPPPVHGQSKNTAILVHDLRGRCDLRVADLSPGSLERGKLYHARKCAKVIRAVWIILRASIRRRRRLYITTDGGLGLIYNLLLVTIGRALGFELFLHHRSFSFVDRRMVLMAAVASVAGRRAQHVFLCPAMAERYQQRYPDAAHSRIVSNAMHVRPLAEIPDRSAVRSDWLRIGLLSNLGPEKGLTDFLDLLRAAAAEGLSIQGILAGPPSSEASAHLIASAGEELGDRLKYLGPVYGQAKESFFREIDLFVFPTRYPVEAQPNVLFEAMSFGVPVISYGRGCVATELLDSGMVVVPPEDEFVRAVIPVLRRLLDAPDSLTQSRQAALDFIQRLRTEALDQYEQLLAVLSGERGQHQFGRQTPGL